MRKKKIFIRLGGDEENIYLDLGDPEWRMVHITAKEWTIKPHGSRKANRADVNSVEERAKLKRARKADVVPASVCAGMSSKLADKFCRMVTGGQIGDRKLFTTDDHKNFLSLK